jgi:hypothetical protein
MVWNAPTQTRGSCGCAFVPHPSICRVPRVLACSLLLVALTGPFAQANAAPICKYLARDGRITYSNLGIGPRGASKVECFETPAPVRASPTTRGTADAEPAMSDAQAPGALEQQLADEEERLEQAQRALSEQEANLSDDGDPYFYDSLGPYVDAVAAHRRSRDRIRRELAEHGRGRTPSHDTHLGTSASRPPDEGSDSAASMHGWPAIGRNAGRPEHQPATGLGQDRGGQAGSRSESGMGRR